MSTVAPRREESGIQAGWYEVVVIKEYYRAYVEYLCIYAGEQREIEADLERI